MTDHRVTISFAGDDRPDLDFVCEAPPQSPCRARWNCGCEAWTEYQVNNSGNPEHRSAGTTWHEGWFGEECTLGDWFSETEALTGQITVGLDTEWVFGGGPLFRIVSPPAHGVSLSHK